MKQNNNVDLIMPSGYKSIAIAFFVSIVSFLFICDTLGWIALLAGLFFLYSHRNPILGFIPKDEKNIYAPIQGKISSIDTKEDKYKVYIDVNLCNAHVLRAPKDGKFTIKKFIHGLNLCHNTYKAKQFNTRATIKIDDVKMKLLVGLCNKEISFTKESGEKVETSDIIGMFFHGQVCVEFPKDKYDIQVSIGDKLEYETKLATPLD